MNLFHKISFKINREIILILLLIFFSYNFYAQTTSEKELEEVRLLLEGNPEKAAEMAKEVYASSTYEDIQLNALISVVKAYTIMDERKKAIIYANEALKLAEGSKDKSKQIRVLGMLGEQYQIYHLNKIARTYFKKADSLLNITQEQGKHTQLIRANLFAVTGNSYKDELDCSYAIENYNQAIEIYKNFTDSKSAQNNLVLMYMEKAECLLEMSDFKTAEIYFQKTLEEAVRLDLLEFRVQANLGLAQIDIALKDYSTAIEKLNLLEEQADNYNSIAFKVRLYDNLKMAYYKTGEVKKYVLAEQKYQHFKEEINKTENQNFQDILSFMEEKKTPESDKNYLQKILLYSIAFIIIGLVGWKFYNLKNRIKE